MDKNIQDLIWACLPKEAREEIKKRYKTLSTSFLTERYMELNTLFGYHNLSSDTEPEELLHISRQSVIDKYAEIFWNKSAYLDSSPEAMQCQACLNVLKSLFGDKCLPDTTVAENTTVRKKEPNPKYNKGDKVKTNHQLYLNSDIVPIGSILSVKDYEYFGNAGFVYTFKESEIKINEYWLEPYTEPETKPLRVGDKVKVKGEDKVREIFRILPDGCIMFGDKGNIYTLKDIEPYTEEKETMEEKELNLCEILKGHEGETFYSPTFGNVRLDIVDNNYIGVVSNEEAASYKIFANGTYTKNGEICFFPSKDQRDWLKWDKENNKKTPKTWNDIPLLERSHLARVINTPYQEMTSAEKSALALLKIHQLIEVGYGENVSYERCSSVKYENVFKIAPYGPQNNIKFDVIEVDGEHSMNHIMFHTKEQAKEFLSYPENVQLLKDYFMI